MKYFIQQGKSIDLSDQDFIAQGGEGRLYAKHGQVYKIYSDPKQVIAAAKIRELAVLNRPEIIRPLDLLWDAQQRPVGFAMREVNNALPLAQLFTSQFQRQQQVQTQTLWQLLNNIRDTIAFVHQQNCLLVDGNEMNYLVDAQDFSQVYFIDVDSWQTPSFAATAIMPTIRDYHQPNFNVLSDWFAFAILCCQLLLGIHPYKGKHPQFKKYDLEARMQANVSIFNPQVSLPSAVRDFSLLPSDLRSWLERVLEQGERSLPPSLPTQISQQASVQRQTFSGTQQFELSKLGEFAAPIERVQCWMGQRAVFAGDALYLDQQAYLRAPWQQYLIFSPRQMRPILCGIEQGELRLFDARAKQPLALKLKADALLVQANHLHVLYGDKLTRIVLHDTAKAAIATPAPSVAVMAKARQALDGVLYEDLLGQDYLRLLLANGGSQTQAVPALAAYKLHSGKHERGVTVLLANQNGRYDRLLLRHGDAILPQRIEQDVDCQEPNFCVLDNGLLIHIPQDGELEIFPPSGGDYKAIQDPLLRSDMHLVADGTQVLFFQDNSLYQLKMR